MKLRFSLIAFVVALLGPGAAAAQLASHFERPALALRTGAVQTVNAEREGLASYAEVQALANLGDTPFGLAAYGGISYERYRKTRYIVCVVGPCLQPDESFYETFTDFVAGVRFGLFPRKTPVDVFAGLASHLVRHGTGSRARWPWYPVVELGTNARVPVTKRFSAEAGVLGFWPVRVEVGTPEHRSGPRSEEDMSRYGFHLGVQYRL